MSLGKLNMIALLAVILLAAVSCKDDETETLPSLSGLYFECPLFAAPGKAVTLTPKEVEHPEGGEVGYYWRVTPTMKRNDTTKVYVHWFSDTLKTYTVSCYAFAEGYNGTSYSRNVEVVASGLDGSLTQTGIKASDKKVTVDGIDYYYEKIGSLEWFRNNLANVQSGAPYANEELVSDIFGRYYSYNEAMTACPEGWRLPSEEDWMSLAEAMESPASEKYVSFQNVAAKLMVNAYFNELAMLEYWPVVGEVNNESRLGFIPFGYANLGLKNDAGKYPVAKFEGMKEYFTVWTSDMVEGEEGMAYYRYIIADRPEMLVGKGDVNTFGASVRCVRDAE